MESARGSRGVGTPVGETCGSAARTCGGAAQLGQDGHGAALVVAVAVVVAVRHPGSKSLKVNSVWNLPQRLSLQKCLSNGNAAFVIVEGRRNIPFGCTLHVRMNIRMVLVMSDGSFYDHIFGINFDLVFALPV